MGTFVAIEGGDGSGKATQALELETRALKQGYDVLHVGFPQYGSPSARFIERYLNGRYGPAMDINPELASMLYAVDRYSASAMIRDHLKKPHSLVISDRYVASNLAHQGTKVKGKRQRTTFYEEILELEYEVLGLPKPDLNIVLLVPPAIAQENIDQKPTRSYTSDKRDGHERDADHLAKANRNYKELTELYPGDFMAVSCIKPGTSAMRSISEIHEDIWNAVIPILYGRA